MELIEQIREKCVEVNPAIGLTGCYHDMKHSNCAKCLGLPRPIRLADVLLAMNNSSARFSDGIAIDRAGRFFNWLEKDEHVPSWNLRQDDLTKQSPETLAFIGKVLGITN